MKYPFGFEGSEEDEDEGDGAPVHPDHERLLAYCGASLRSYCESTFLLREIPPLFVKISQREYIEEEAMEEPEHPFVNSSSNTPW